MKNDAILQLLLICVTIALAAEKTVYIPLEIKNSMDVNNSSSQWCYDRSRESDNIVVFWEAGYGSDPSSASGDYRVDMNTLLEVAENAYSFYRDTLQFIIQGLSLTDTYKMNIYLEYKANWKACGAGQDDKIGSLWLSAPAAKVDNVIAHELGHCFQYMTKRDAEDGFDYGLGENGKGGNGFWEQCAQWMSFKVYPDKQFTEHDFDVYVKNNHLHILHEIPRYANYFLPDFWTYKHDITFIGKLWRESVFPEDPVEVYKRLNSLSQEQFNDEMYEHAARLTTWDIPAIVDYGKNYIDKREQVKMSQTSDQYWKIDNTVCIENYGYNSIKLNPPSSSENVMVYFRGIAGAEGYRSISIDKGGWRFGFVALLDDDSRVYSETGTAKVNGNESPEETLTFSCPDKCEKLWLVVSGAPQEHWKHEWDDTTYNDEQWPYEVRFSHTNLLGEVTELKTVRTEKINNSPALVRRYGRIMLPRQGTWKITSLSGRQVMAGYGRSVDISFYSSGGYVLYFEGKCTKIVKIPSQN